MNKRIFITATNTDIGKTYTTKLLLREFASRGLRVGVIKPVETGVVGGVYLDGDELLKKVQELNIEFEDIKVEDIVPISYKLPAAPFVASNAQKFDFKTVDAKVKLLEDRCDVLIFEGAGGLLVPIDENNMVVDLIKYYKASALLVTHCSLGCINDTLLSKKVLDDLDIKHTVAFNCRESDSSFKDVSEPYFNKIGFEVLKVSEQIDKICDVLYNLQNKN
ncbi:dethiobiotin synthase [Sulfurimonas lithotrophica]|uniref:ATP-dependent dethiobiotin synthetase BioD n=1 Tax=Sulfurimonas lithotrophica TaxID=2590022 RepID=A0A5P8NZ06_9BACT|nr:dethiobiotin synthase [Sulfurimonas lithotrophica]QFR48683.1 dethiobiotin synthase [Sulfurimonas lithotrophica]